MSIHFSTSTCFLVRHISFGHIHQHLSKARSTCRRVFCSSTDGANEILVPDGKYLEREMAAARREKRPYRIDKTLMTPQERQQLRLRSKSIPMVIDHDPIDVLHEDDTFLVVCKPSFIKMHPSHRFQGGTLLNRVIGHLGYTPWLLHRLDMHTTGVVVFAKKKEICAPIMAQFREGTVRKDYICVVDGNRNGMEVGTEFTVDTPIQRHSNVSFMREVGNTKDGWKNANTAFQVMRKPNEGGEIGMMVLRAIPKTGRTHQIRVHALHAGLPIIGDDLYNPKETAMYKDYEEISNAAHDETRIKYADGNVLRKGLKLHARKITLLNPETDKPVTFCAPPPTHMVQLIESAGMETV